MAFIGRGKQGESARYALLPLRIFLGVTFIYAGLDKLTDSGFLAATGPGSIGELMRTVRGTSAVPWLVDLALKNPEGFGYAIGLGEFAVGVGTLFGIFARVAAAGGALISLSLWLTVSWQTTPYYYGNDLIYLMAWLPLVVAGAPVWSVDAGSVPWALKPARKSPRRPARKPSGKPPAKRSRPAAKPSAKPSAKPAAKPSAKPSAKSAAAKPAAKPSGKAPRRSGK
ncbi:DoxX family protein [Streptosporangium nondiastaticum]|uniref:DoxX family protein n=1 Tax=Streptosporangium nondiastaticum TaxID=35764 RepID=UPI001CB8C6A9|nr:DoxX family protein [Streptosporangium nondiastaticum]